MKKKNNRCLAIKKRTLAVLVSLLMLFAFFPPTTVFAGEEFTIILKILPDERYGTVTITGDGVRQDSQDPNVYYAEEGAVISFVQNPSGTSRFKSCILEYKYTGNVIEITREVFEMPGGDVRMMVTFAPMTYSLTLNTNGGTINSGDMTSYSYGTGGQLPTDVTKTGYTFAGWYNNEELTGSPVTSITTTDEGNKTYWAKWTSKAPTIIQGNEAIFQKQNNETLSFISDAEYADFLKVQIDGKDLDKVNYDVKEGSTIVTLNSKAAEEAFYHN